jgi:hypothetical protein
MVSRTFEEIAMLVGSDHPSASQVRPALADKFFPTNAEDSQVSRHLLGDWQNPIGWAFPYPVRQSAAYGTLASSGISRSNRST